MNWIKYSLAFFAGMLALSACQSEMEPNGESVVTIDPTTRLTINSEDPGTKTYMSYDEENNLYAPFWKNGDAIGVFVDDFVANASAASCKLINGSADGATASFSGDVSALSNETHTAYAFYPARAFYGTESGKVVRMEIPEIQFPINSSFDPKADLLVGVPMEFDVTGGEAEPIEGAHFRRVCAILKVKLQDNTGGNPYNDKVKSVRLDFASDQYVTGAFRYDFAKEEACSEHLVDGLRKNYVTADYSGSPVEFDSDFFLLVNPGTYTGALTVTVQTDKHEIVKTVNNINWELKSGKVCPITVKLGTNTTVERVYFQDNFDWLHKWWDTIYHNAYEKQQVQLTPVESKSIETSGTPPYAQPNIWNNYSSSIGQDFNNRYVDLSPAKKVMYIQDNYLKWCRTANESGLQLPPLDLGDNPVDVILSFDFAIQNKKKVAGNYVVEVLNDDSEVVDSKSFSADNSLQWESKSFTLNGLTAESKIKIRPNVTDPDNTGRLYNFWLDNIKVTAQESSKVEWSFLPPNKLTAETDYHLEGGCLSGTYLYADDHMKGRIYIHRAAGTGAVTDKNPTYKVRDGDDAFPGYTQLLTYGIGKGSAFEFELFYVDNPAGTYTIDFNITASAGGAKYFGIQYSTDEGSSWSASQGVEGEIATTAGGSEMVNYSFALAGVNVRKDVQKSFHMGAVKCKKFLIRAVAVSKINQQDTPGNTNDNTTATCRIFAADSADDNTSKVYVAFTPDTP